MSAVIIDAAEDITAKLPRLPKGSTVIGYLSSINPSGPKCWTTARMRAVQAAGLRAGIVHEGWGGVQGKGISAADGDRDGAYSRKAAPVLGAPKGACIYFACDRDFSAAEIRSLVIPYFASIRRRFADGFYRVGVYGSGAVCAAVRAAHLADLSWEAGSKGWTGFKDWEAKADLVQTVDTNTAGIPSDSDVAHGDFGDFVPYSESPPSAPAEPPHAAPAPAPHVPSQAALDAGFTAARAAVDHVAGSWKSWISDSAVRQVVAATLAAAYRADPHA